MEKCLEQINALLGQFLLLTFSTNAIHFCLCSGFVGRLEYFNSFKKFNQICAQWAKKNNCEMTDQSVQFL